MNLSHRLSHCCLFLYRSINHTGLLDCAWAQTVFISCYFAYKKYLEDPTAKLTQNHPELFQSGHILDIGANIGYTAYVFSKALTAPYQIFAFEPENRNLAILKKVARAYHFSHQIRITEAAIGDQEGEIEIWQNDRHHADHRILTDELRKKLSGYFQVQKKPLITIDHFLKNAQIDEPIAFIKIDVQGYELAVCEGMKATLAANPHCVIQFEYCPSIMKSLGYEASELIHFFQVRNYHFYRIPKNGKLIPFEPDNIHTLHHTQEYFDILCSQKNILEKQSCS